MIRMYSSYALGLFIIIQVCFLKDASSFSLLQSTSCKSASSSSALCSVNGANGVNGGDDGDGGDGDGGGDG